MKFAVIGSCIGMDIINKAKNLGWSLSSSCVSFSPLSLLDAQNNHVNIKHSIFSKETSKEKDMLVDNINNNILNNIKKSNPDYVLVDLSDLRIPVEYLKFANGKQVAYTKKTLSEEGYNALYTQLEATLNSKIIDKSQKTASNLTDEELKSFLQSYVELLSSVFEKRRLIFFKPRLANQYINGDSVLYTPNHRIVGSTNLFINRVYNVFSQIEGYIDAPAKIIGDITCLSPFEYHFCQPYYDYMISSILFRISAQQSSGIMIDNALVDCEEKIHRLYNRIFCQQILDKIRNRLDKDIVLIAKTRQFEEMLKSRFQKDIFAYIPYNQSTSIEWLREQIVALQEQHDNLIYVVPELFNHQEKGLQCVFYENYLVREQDYFVPIYRPVRMENFSGEYEDIYNNRFSVKTPNTIEFTGAAIEIDIGTSSTFTTVIIASGSRFKLGDKTRMTATLRFGFDSYMSIGNDTTMWQADIACHSFSTIIIGNDVMTSAQEMIYSGDGHSIFQLQDSGEYEIINSCTEDEIVIGNHVWIGYRCNIIGGADIGDGCIVGASSMVNKKFPNNVLIVGTPAKIIKRNVAWSRNVLIKDIKKDKKLYESFANETVE